MLISAFRFESVLPTALSLSAAMVLPSVAAAVLGWDVVVAVEMLLLLL